MEVLKKGRPQKGWAETFTCTGNGNGGGGCGAELRVHFEDLFKTCAMVLGEKGESFVTFHCPECHVCTDIDYRGPNRHLIR